MAEQKLPHCVDLEVSTKHAATVQNPKQMWPMENSWESVSLSLSLSSLGSWSEPPWDRIFPNGKLDCDAFFLVNKCGKLVNHRCCQLLSTLNQPRASSKIAADCTLNWKIHICTIHQPSWTHFYDIFVVWGADICWYCCMSRLELEDPPEFSISLGLESSSYEPGVNRPTCLFGIEELLLRLSSAKDDDYLNPIAGELENPKVAEWRAPQTCAQSCFLSWPTSLWLCCFGKMRPFFGTFGWKLLAWFHGKATGNHGSSHENQGFPAFFSISFWENGPSRCQESFWEILIILFENLDVLQQHSWSAQGFSSPSKISYIEWYY